MAGAPPLAFRVDRRGVWRAGVGALVLLAMVALGTWWMLHPAPVPGWVTAAAVGGCCGVAICGASLLAAGAADSLHWDGRQWWHARGPGEPLACGVGVAIDLGDWILLRVVPVGRSAWFAARWIPVQRRGLEAVWHPLRCAVYARPRRDEAAAS